MSRLNRTSRTARLPASSHIAAFPPQLAELTQELAVAVPYHKGDVMLVDNFLCQHSRNSFVPPRRILAYLNE